MACSASSLRAGCLRAALAALIAGVGCSSGGGSPQWADANRRVIDQNKVSGRTREVPSVRVPMTLADGVPVEAGTLSTITIAPGVVATLGWGRGALLERVEMRPDAVVRKAHRPGQLLDGASPPP